jgi:hypothetical protein
MGFFDSIIKSFKKQDETVDLTLDNAGTWFERKTKQKIDENETEINLVVQEINEMIIQVKKDLQLLETSKLRNEKIDERMKNFMSGNRSNYIKQVSMFIESVKMDNNRNIDSLIKNFEEKVDSLNKSSARSYYILQEFFAHESSKVAEDIKKMDEAVKKIKQLKENPEITMISQIKNTIKEMREKIEKKESLTKEIEELRSRESQIGKQILNKQNDISILESSEDFLKTGKTKLEIQEKESVMRKLDFEITQLFSPLSRAFRKYERIGIDDVSLIKKYDDASDGLLDDENLKILEVMQKIKKLIAKGELDLKDDDKTIKKIDEITREKLITIRIQYKQVKQEKEKLEKETRANKILVIYEDTKLMLKSLEDQLERTKKEIQKKTDTYNMIEIESYLGNLNQKIKEITEVEVKISA